jgi:exosortase family protein XrtF
MEIKMFYPNNIRHPSSVTRPPSSVLPSPVPKISYLRPMSKPLTFIFLFLGSYLLLQLSYTGYLYLFQPGIDPITLFTAKVLVWVQPNASLITMEAIDKAQVLVAGKAIYNVKEACNGISVMLSVLAFMIAFLKPWKAYAISVPSSIFILFVANQLRLLALIQVQLHYPSHFVFFHEYLFPAFIYLFAFLIMVGFTKLFKQA